MYDELNEYVCSNCGAKLKITPNSSFVKCDFCDSSYQLLSSQFNPKDQPFEIKCNSLTAYKGQEDIVVIPYGVEVIEKSVFRNSNVSIVIFPCSLKEIEAYAFADCKNLRTISIPQSVERIGNRAFWRCENLFSIDCPDSVMCGEGVFLGTKYYKDILGQIIGDYYDEIEQKVVDNRKIYGLCPHCGSNYNIFGKCKKCGRRKEK